MSVCTNLRSVEHSNAPGGGTVRSRQDRQDAFTVGAAYGLLLIAGGLLGLVGSFQYGRLDFVVAPGNGVFDRIPLGALLIVLGTAGLCWCAAWGMRSRAGAVVPGVGWLIISYLLSLPHGGGDVIIAGNLAGGVYLYGGLILIGVAIVTARPGRSLLAPPSLGPRVG